MAKIPRFSPSQRIYLILVSLVVLLLVALIAGAYGADSLLNASAVKLTTAKAKSQALHQQQLSLLTARKEIKDYAGLYQIAQTIVPEDKSQTQAVRQIVDLATANGVRLSGVTFQASTLGTTSAGATSSTGSAATTTGGAPTSAVSSTTSLDNPNASTSKLSQLVPVPNIPGVYDLQIVVTTGTNNPAPYDSIVNYLAALEHNRRTAQISTITLQPSTQNPDLLNFTLTINDYIKPS